MEQVPEKPVKIRRRGPQKDEATYKTSADYCGRRQTKIIRNRPRRACRHHCIVCEEEVLTSNIVRHMSLVHNYPLKLQNYLLDITRIKHQQQGKNRAIKDCLHCMRRFVIASNHRHRFYPCTIVDVPNFTSLDGLCLRATAIMALCDGDLRDAYEVLRQEFERD